MEGKTLSDKIKFILARVDVLNRELTHKQVMDAVTSHRPYMPCMEALLLLQENEGTALTFKDGQWKACLAKEIKAKRNHSSESPLHAVQAAVQDKLNDGTDSPLGVFENQSKDEPKNAPIVKETTEDEVLSLLRRAGERSKSVGLAYRGSSWEAFYQGECKSADDPLEAILKCIESYCPDALEDTEEPPPRIYAKAANRNPSWWTRTTLNGTTVWLCETDDVVDLYRQNELTLVPNKHQDMEQARKWLGGESCE